MRCLWARKKYTLTPGIKKSIQKKKDKIIEQKKKMDAVMKEKLAERNTLKSKIISFEPFGAYKISR